MSLSDFQERVGRWITTCFTPEIANDMTERCDRALEERLELVQAGYAKSGEDFANRAHSLVDYVANRPVGELPQEVGGDMVTLAALCNAFGIDMVTAAEAELARIIKPEIIDKIRAKQAAKPTGSALPIAEPQNPEIESLRAELAASRATTEKLAGALKQARHDIITAKAKYTVAVRTINEALSTYREAQP